MNHGNDKQGHPLLRFRNLSGERLRKAEKAWLQVTCLGVVGAVVVMVASSFHSDTLFFGAWGLVLLASAVLFGRQLERRETYWQLLSEENRSLKQKAQDNLKDLEEFAKAVSKENRNGG